MNISDIENPASYHASKRPLDHAESNDQNHEISWHPTYDCLAMSLSYLPRLHTQIYEYSSQQLSPPQSRDARTAVTGVAPFNHPPLVIFYFSRLHCNEDL